MHLHHQIKEVTATNDTSILRIYSCINYPSFTKFDAFSISTECWRINSAAPFLHIIILNYYITFHRNKLLSSIRCFTHLYFKDVLFNNALKLITVLPTIGTQWPLFLLLNKCDLDYNHTVPTRKSNHQTLLWGYIQKFLD